MSVLGASINTWATGVTILCIYSLALWLYNYAVDKIMADIRGRSK